MGSQPLAFSDVLDAAEQLDDDGQAELIAILSRRIAGRGRERLIATVEQARRESIAGQCRSMTATDLIQEASSRGGSSCARLPSRDLRA